MTSRNVPAGLTPAAVYDRISQDPEFTLSGAERHIRLCLRRVQESSAWALAPLPGALKDPADRSTGRWPDGVLVDNNISAARGAAKSRSEYDRLMAAVDAGEVRVIVAYSQSRLWRERRQRADGFTRLAAAKVRLEFVKGASFDFADATSRMVAGIIGETDEWFTEITKENQRATAADHAERGAYHGKRPFGFDRIAAPGGKRGGERSLIIRDKEAHYLREAYRRADPDGEAQTLWQICRWLDDQGVLTPTGLSWREAGPGSLSGILCAARNIGLREHAEGWDGHGHRPYAERGSKNLHPGNWPAVIDDVELFWRVREMLADPARRRPGPRPEPKHLLTGFTYCGRCGGPMFVQHNRSRPRWTCQRCWTVRAAGQVNAEAERTLLRWMADNGPFGRAMVQAEPGDLAALRVTLDGLRAKRREVLDDFYDDKITREDRDHQVARKDAQISEIETRLREYDRELTAAGVETRGDAFARSWHQWSTEGLAGLEKQRRVIARMIKRVVVYPAGRTNDPSPDLIVVEPGDWAARLDNPGEVAAAAAPDHESLTPRARAVAVLAAAGERWLSGAEVAAALGRDPAVTKNLLRRMVRDGAAERAWLPCGTGPANGDMTIDQAREASAGRTLRGAGCHGYRLRRNDDARNPAVDRAAAPAALRTAVPARPGRRGRMAGTAGQAGGGRLPG